ncbi:MAG: lipoprotein insertase outer membrane protein LolB [Methylophilaceae bacterium]|nr:lipoprotein insertase outer membrane protein LolB [Methyloradius sp.]
MNISTNWLRHAAVSLVLTTLAGCATMQPAVNVQSSSSAQVNQQHLKSIASINHFGIQGRIGVQTDNRGFSGSTRWSHAPDSDSMAIFSPLGSQVATIEASDDGVTLIADGKTYKADDTETLTQQTLGWRLPMEGLPDWVLGRPNPNHLDSTSEWDASGRLTKLSQDGWNIEYSNYVAASGFQLPRKITLRSVDGYGASTAQKASPKIVLKLVVERWDVIAEPLPIK